MEEFETKPLFGGALEISLPKRFIDISDFREVPDNQEIFADSANTDQSFIIELLEFQSEVQDANIAQHLFEDLCELNGVPKSHASILSVINVDNEALNEHFPGLFKQGLVGQQRVAKHRDSNEVANIVNFYLGVVRLRNVHTDLLVTFNDPVVLHEQSSSSANSIAVGMDTERSLATFKRVFSSLKVNDYSIFNV